MDFAEIGYRVDTKGIKDGVRELDRLDDAGKRVDGSSRKAASGMGAAGLAGGSLARGLGSIGGIVAGLGLATVGAQALGMARDFDTSMNNVQAKLGATELAMSGLRDMAKDLGSTTAFSASEAADGMGFLAQAGLDASEIMEAMPVTLQLASAASLDLAASADIATNVMGGFQLSVSDLPRVADVLAATSSKANTSVAEMAGAMKRVGPVASSFGVSLEESAAAVGILANAGIKADEAGTGLAAMFTRLVNPIGEGKEAMDALGLSVEDFTRIGADGQIEFKGIANALDVVKGSGADAKDMMKLFGQEAGPKLIALVNAGGDAVRDLEGSIQSSGQAAAMAETQMQGLPGALKNVSSAWEGLNIAVMEMAGSGLAVTALNGLTSALRFMTTDGIEFLQNRIVDVQIELRNFRTNLQFSDDLPFVALRAMGDALSAMGGYLAPLTPYLDEFAIALVSIGGSAAGVALIAAALSAVAAVALSPVVLGVAALAAGAVAIRENWDGIAAWWSGLWNGIRGDSEGFGEWWSEATVADVGRAASSVLLAFVDVAIDAAAAFGSVISTHIGTAIDSIDWPSGADILQGAASLATGFGELAGELLARLVDGLSDRVGSIGSDIEWPTAGAIIGGARDLIGAFADLATVVIGGLQSGLARGIGRVLDDFKWPSSTDVLRSAAGMVAAFGSLALDTARVLATSLQGAASDAVDGIEWPTAAEIGQQAAQLLIGFTQLARDAVIAFGDGVTGIDEAIEWPTFADIVSSAGDLLRGFAETAGVAVSSFVFEIGRGLFAEMSRIDYPSLGDLLGWMAESIAAWNGVAVAMIDSLASGITSLNGRVREAVVGMFDFIPGVGNDASRLAESAGRDVVGGTERGILDRLADLFGAGAEMGVAIEDGFDTQVERQSPAKKFIRAAGDVVQGLVIGMRNGGSVLFDIAQEMGGRIELGISSALQDASSISEALGNIGDFMRDWIKGVIADFAANRIMVSLGFATPDATGTTGILNGALGGPGTAEGGQRPPSELANSTGSIGAELGTAAVGLGALYGGLSLVQSALGGANGLVSQMGALARGLESYKEALPGYTAAIAEVPETIEASIRRMGVGIPDSLNQQLTDIMERGFNFSVSDAGRGSALLAEALTERTREAYAAASEAMGGYIGEYIGNGIDIGTATVEEFEAVFAHLGEVAETVLPSLLATGAMVGETADAQVVAGAMLVDAIGDMGEAVSLLDFFAQNFVPQAEQAAFALDNAQGSVESFNAGLNIYTQAMYGGVDSIINTKDELLNYYRSLDQTTEAGAAAAAEVLNVADSFTLLHDARIAEAEEIRAVADVTRTLGLQFSDTSPAIADAALNLVALVGGLEEFNQANAYFFENFYSGVEQQGIALESAYGRIGEFNASLAAAGVEAVTTKEGLRELYESLDLSTQSGRELAAGILDVDDAFVTVANSAQLRSEALQAAAEESRESTRAFVDVTEAAAALNLTFNPTAEGARDSALALVELMGGLKKFNEATTNYVNEFYSDEEQTALALASSAAAVQLFNDELALTGDAVIDTRDEFRTYVEGLDLTTDAGRRAYAAAMDVADSMAVVVDSGGSLREAIDSLPPHLQGAFNVILEGTANFAGEVPRHVIDALASIIDSAAVAGPAMQSSLIEAFDAVMADAGIMREDLPAELRAAYDIMTGETQNLKAALESDFMAVEAAAGLTGGALVDRLGSAFDFVMSGAGETGLGLRNDFHAAFEAVLAGAGIVREDLPVPLREAYDQMLENAIATASGLEGASADGSQALDGMADAGGDMASNMGTAANALDRIADVLVGAFGDIGNGAQSAANSISASYRRIRNQETSLEAERDADRRASGSFAGGLDMVTQPVRTVDVHYGEMIATADVSAKLRAMGVTATSIPPGFGESANSSVFSVAPAAPDRDNGAGAMVAELKELRREIADLRRERSEDARQADQRRDMIASNTDRQVAATKKAERTTERGYRKITEAVA